jgi:hypothetical protein
VREHVLQLTRIGPPSMAPDLIGRTHTQAVLAA